MRKLNEVKTRISDVKKRLDRIRAAIRSSRRGSLARARLAMALNTAERVFRTMKSRNRHLVQYEADARAAVEGARQLLQEAAEAAVNAAHLVRYMGQAVRFLSDHYAAARIKVGGTVGLEAKIGIPGVSLQNVGAGIGAEAEAYGTIEFEFPETHGDPVLLTITRHFGAKAQGNAGLVAAADLAVDRAMVLTDRFTLVAGEATPTEKDVQIVTNFNVTGGLGIVIAEQMGIGRSVSMSMTQDELFYAAGNIESGILEGDLMQLLEALADVEVSLSIQDRLEWGYAGKLGISAAGNGGAVDGGATWADQGRLLKTDITVAEAAALVLSHEKVQEAAQALGNAYQQVSN
jgi:hypothetical protein